MAKKKKGGKESKEADKEGKAAEEEQQAEPVVVEESIADKRRRNNIRTAFALFDKEGEHRVVQEDIPAIIRYLGQHPTETQVTEEILPGLQSEEPDAYIMLEKFEPRMFEMLKNDEFPPDGHEVLLSAFKALDEEKKGYVEAEYVKELLTQMGTPFRAKELDSFFNVAKDITTGRIYYEDYVNLYSKQTDTVAKKWRDAKLHSEEILESKLKF